VNLTLTPTIPVNFTPGFGEGGFGEGRFGGGVVADSGTLTLAVNNAGSLSTAAPASTSPVLTPATTGTLTLSPN
jgi:hypothetical protein